MKASKQTEIKCTTQYLEDTFTQSYFHWIQGAHFISSCILRELNLWTWHCYCHPLPFSLNICTQAQCVTWRDEERVALFQLYSLAAVWTVTQEDITLFAWQHPVFKQRQIVWAWRNQPEDLENEREREQCRCDSKLGYGFTSLKWIIHKLVSALIIYLIHLFTSR